MNKKWLIVITIMGVLILSYFLTIKVIIPHKQKSIMIGKSLYINIDENEICDGNEIMKIELWDKKARSNLSEHMKQNELKLKHGEYKINQATTYEEALKIFEFEKIE